MTKSKRALEATRLILNGRDTARPVHHVEAISISKGNRDELVEKAAGILATCADPVAAIEEIVAAFFVDRIEDDAGAPGAESIQMRVYRARLNLRKMHPILGDVEAPAEAENVPGREIDDEDGAPLNDDGRTLEEIRTAVEVLALAVRMNADLAIPVTAAAMKLEKLNGSRFAEQLHEAAAAAGTKSLEPAAETDAEREMIRAATFRGYSGARALHFSRAYDKIRGIKVPQGRALGRLREADREGQGRQPRSVSLRCRAARRRPRATRKGPLGGGPGQRPRQRGRAPARAPTQRRQPSPFGPPQDAPRAPLRACGRARDRPPEARGSESLQTGAGRGHRPRGRNRGHRRDYRRRGRASTPCTRRQGPKDDRR